MYILPTDMHFAVSCRVKDGDKIRLDKTRERQKKNTYTQTDWLIERPIN
jgi:hypothetical protein